MDKAKKILIKASKYRHLQYSSAPAHRQRYFDYHNCPYKFASCLSKSAKLYHSKNHLSTVKINKNFLKKRAKQGIGLSKKLNSKDIFANFFADCGFKDFVVCILNS